MHPNLIPYYKFQEDYIKKEFEEHIDRKMTDLLHIYFMIEDNKKAIDKMDEEENKEGEGGTDEQADEKKEDAAEGDGEKKEENKDEESGDKKEEEVKKDEQP